MPSPLPVERSPRCAPLAVRSPVAVTTVLATLLLSGAGWVIAGGGFVLADGRVIAGGGVAESAGGCLQLHGSLGQDTLGQASGGAFSVRSGFWAVAPRSDALFHHGFQECL